MGTLGLRLRSERESRGLGRVAVARATKVWVHQLAALERRTRAGGRDIIDHPPGGHDDLANAVAGVSVVAATPRRMIGAMFTTGVNRQRLVYALNE